MKAEGVIENYDMFVGKVKNFSRENKQKVGELEQEMEQIGQQLDKREQEIAIMREQYEKQEAETDTFMSGLGAD